MDDEIKLGSPWSILPIKNNKYARDLTEVHLSGRNLTGLEHFEQFPNLEEIWLSNNKLRNLDDIESNFRCKKVVCQNNSIENINGLKKFKFLDTLLLGNNQLRDLDKFLLQLTKFAFMTQLDLFGNPLAEEPDYRLKIIYLMPQIKTLDRHVVTVAERIKAKRICEEEYHLTQGSGPVAVNKQQRFKRGPKGDGFSMGEKDLYKNYNKIMKKQEEEKQAELEKTRLFFSKKEYIGIPTPTMKQQNKDSFGQNTEDKLDEWEKNQVKEAYSKFDADLKQGVTKENLISIMESLMKDECIIGKVPDLTEQEIQILFDKWPANDEGKYFWQQFKDGLNTWLWKLQDREVLQKMVDEFFALSLKYKMQGKSTESQEMATKALRLEGSLTKCKPIDIAKKQDDGLSKRGDFLIIKKHRRKEQDPDALLPTDEFNDKTFTHKF